MSALPFQLSSSAYDWLSRLPERKDEELGFVCSPRFGVSRGSDVVESFNREHYVFVHARPEVWANDRSAVRFAIGRKAFWLVPEIITGLTGRTLDVIRVDVGQGQHAGIFREFLVALATEKEPN